MWIIRYQIIETKDYNKISRVLDKLGIFPKKFSGIILLKGVISHILQKKSWRKISSEIKIPYLVVYNFYTKIFEKKEFFEILEYFCKRKIILFSGKEKFISKQQIESDFFLEGGILEIKKILENLKIN